MRTGCHYSGGAAVQELTLQSRTCFCGSLMLTRQPLECVACGGGRVVTQCGLKLSTGFTGSGVSREVPAKVSPCL